MLQQWIRFPSQSATSLAQAGIGMLLMQILTVGFGVPVQSALCAADPETQHWFVVSFDGSPVGFEQIKTQKTKSDGRTLVACYRRTQITLKRLGQDLTVRASLWTQQSETGDLVYFHLQRVDASGARTERTGTLDSARNVFRVNELAAATRRVFDLRVSGPVKSPIVSEWLPALMKTARNTLIVPVLFPESATVASISAGRRRNRKIRISNKAVDAAHIVFAPQLEPSKRTTLFADSDNSSLLRSEQSVLGGTLSIETSNAETALTATANRSLNLDLLAPVPVSSLLSAPKDRTKLVLDLSVKDGFLPDIPETAFQKVQRLNATTSRITLLKPDIPRNRARPAAWHQHPAAASTRWMPLEDVRLQRMAATASAGSTDTVEVCRHLEQFVRSKMKHSAFSTSIVPANEVARTLRGDCTEHAVLLAALMRIKGIPARIASGLAHTNQQFGFVGHAWVEAMIDRQWVPFDSSATGGLTHIKLAHSDLSDAESSGIFLFLPLLDIAGQAQATVVSDR